MRFQLLVLFAFALFVAAMASVSEKASAEKRDKRYIYPYGGYAAAFPYAAPYTYPYPYAPAYSAYPAFAPFYAGYPSPYYPYYG